MTKKDSGVGRQKYSNVVCENIVIVVLTIAIWHYQYFA